MYIDIFICIQIGPSEQKQTHEPFICLIFFFFFFSPIEKKFSAEADVKVGQCENGSRIPGSWKEGNTRSSEPQRKCFSN